MPAEIAPPELAQLLDYAERPRADDWSLRSALMRYAQPEPTRVSQVLEHVRRIEWVLHPHLKLLEREGPAIWPLVTDGSPLPASEPERTVVGLLRAATELDRLGDLLADWAVARATERPDAEVDRVVAEVGEALDGLGIPREAREGPPWGRRGERRG